MLTTEHLNAFVARDTRVVASALIDWQILGTEVGDLVLAVSSGNTERHNALKAELIRRNAWEVAA